MTKSPAKAFCMSIIPGAGQYYALGREKGLPRAIAALAIFGCSLWTLLILVGFVIVPLVWLGIALDAAGQAVLVNKK